MTSLGNGDSKESFVFGTLGPALGLGLIFAGGAKAQSAERFVAPFEGWGLAPS